MEASHYNAENCQMIEVEIYETGEKTCIAAKNQTRIKKNKLDRFIITAAQYSRYKAETASTQLES